MSTKVPLKGFSLYLACSICMANIDILCAFATLFFWILFVFVSCALFRFRCTFTVRSCRCCSLYRLPPVRTPSPPPPNILPTDQLWHFICFAQVDPLSFVCVGKKKKKSKIEVEGWPSYYANEYFPCDPAACFCHPKCPAFRIVSPVQWRVPADRQWVSCWFSFVCLKPLCKHFAPPRQRAQTSTPLESDCQLHNEKEWQKMR